MNQLQQHIHQWEQLDQGDAYCIRCPETRGRFNMSPWDFFQRKVCLTSEEHEWKEGLTEFQRVGLADVQKFSAIPDIGPHQSFSRSARQILVDFMESDAETLLHLEDDCQFKALGHLTDALNELPVNWDIVYLGANLVCWNRDGDFRPERYSEHLFRVRQAWTTHAIGYNRKVVPFILDNQPGFSEQMLDNWISSQLPGLNAYVVAPMVAWQRPHYSTIWGRETNYDDVFSMSEDKLR